MGAIGAPIGARDEVRHNGTKSDVEVGKTKITFLKSYCTNSEP